MPRAAFRVEGATNKTRWTLTSQIARNDTPVLKILEREKEEEKEEVGIRMNINMNGHHYGYEQHQEQPLPRYESSMYDGSQYGGSRQSSNSHGRMLNGGSAGFNDFDFTPMDDRGSRQISVNTRVQGGPQDASDAMGHHLLYETALLDAQAFEMLEIAEVDALKKEHVRLNAKIEASQRKLALESKVRDAAQNLQRLYSTKNRRPDTPQSPESPKKNRSSFLGNRQRGGSGSGGTLQQADSELAASVRKVDELNEEIKRLLDRRQYVERKLLKHTAAVLAEQANRSVESAVPGLTNGTHSVADDEGSIYSPDEFDGIRDILHGMPAGGSKKIQEHEQQIAGVQDRLEQLNFQLRNVIGEASRTLGKPPASEAPLDQSEDAMARLDNRFVRLEDNLHVLEQQQQDVKAHYARIQESEYHTRNAVEEQMEGLNGQLHSTLLLASSNTQEVPGLQGPPQATGHGYQNQLQYMEESLMTLEQLLQQHSHLMQSTIETEQQAHDELAVALKSHQEHSRDLETQIGNHQQERDELAATLSSHQEYSRGLETHIETKQQERDQLAATIGSHKEQSADLYAQIEQLQQQHSRTTQSARDAGGKVSEYETVLSGLWEILQSAAPSPRIGTDSTDSDEDAPTPPKTPLQESFSLQAFSSRVQHIFDKVQNAKEQQEILKRQIQQQRELNGKSDAEKDRQFTELRERHEVLSGERDATHEELARVMVLQQQAEAEAGRSREELVNVGREVEELRKMIEMKQSERDGVAGTLREHQDGSREMQAHIEQLQSRLSESQDLEGEVVRLTTELTMAKADLDGAYGSRAQRAGAQAAEVEALNQRQEELERELGEMTAEFQDLAREGVGMERERVQLDALIDGLRERVEGLEGQLSEEKVRWLGMRSPGGGDGGGRERENTSVMVLRQEFKKMVRETRAEGVRLLRAEQEERRRLEAEVRKMRQANGPVTRRTLSNTSSVPAASASAPTRSGSTAVSTPA